jgi:hypothetical protein
VQTPAAVSLYYFHYQLQSVFLCKRLHPELKYLQCETQHMEEINRSFYCFMIFELVSQLRICRIGVASHVPFISIDVLLYRIVALETNRTNARDP